MRGDIMEFEIDVLPASERYVEMLEYLPFIAVALENNGIKPSNSGRVIIVDRHTVQFKGVEVRFLRRQDAVFHYQGNIEWDIGVTQASFKLPIEADLSALANGKVMVRVHLRVAKLIPQAITDRIKLKVMSLSGPAVQQKLLDYFDRLTKVNSPARGVDGLKELILIDGYNLLGASGGGTLTEPGDAEPISDQILLLITLAIWFVIVPLSYAGVHLWRKIMTRRSSR